jgi:single-strand DNA-binding protein
MSDINRTIHIGRMTDSPELKYTPNNVPVCKFILAVNEVYKNSSKEKVESASFFPVVAWNGAAKSISQYGRKGMRIAIDGRLKQRSWTDKNDNKRSTIEIVVDTFQFLWSSKKEDSAPAEEQNQNDNPENQPAFDDCFPVQE